MPIIVLSPHFDDAALSCGGWIAEARQRDEKVEVWTICTGLPADDDFSPLAVEYHGNWALSAEKVIETRTGEDIEAMRILDVSYRHFDFTDGLYRKDPLTGEHLYPDEPALRGSLHPGDVDTLHLLAIQMAAALPQGKVTLVSPLSVGNHVDHQLVRAAIERLPIPILYYPDFPYTRDFPNVAPSLAPVGYLPHATQVSGAALAIWQKSIAAYASQISSFWDSLDHMREEIAEYSQSKLGSVLWQPPSVE